MDYNFFKNNYDDILSLAMTGLNEGKKEDKKEKDVAKDLNESMFPIKENFKIKVYEHTRISRKNRVIV
jgi:hypothetical protein